jgi:anti-sigma regulatory factor (Ser/Thr protein kinase)
VTVIARDDAPAYDPLARAEVDTSLALEDRPVGGLGVHLVKKLMQEARYERRDDTNVLTLVRHITPTA